MKHKKQLFTLATFCSLSLFPLQSHAAQDTYTVQKGDTLWSISQKAHATVNELKKWNNLKTDSLSLGQKLALQANTTGAVSGTVSSKTGEVTASVLNVRSGSGTTYPLTTTLSKGAKVTILEEKNGWMHISYNGKQGWVIKDYIKVLSSSNQSTTPTTPTTPTPSTQKTGEVTASALNVRSSNGTTYPLVTTLAKGAKVTVLDTKNGWVNISYNGTKGWVIADYLEISTNTGGNTTSPTTPTTPSTPLQKIGTVTASALNVRSGSGTSFPLTGTLSKGAKVTILDTKNGWVNISYNGVKGWVISDYLTITTSSGETPTTPTTPSKQYVVVADQLYLRQGAGTNEAILATLQQGTLVTILETKNGWARVTSNGKSGWVSAQYLKEQGSTSTGQPNGKTIVLDAGHGGSDPGAIASDGTREENLTLALALKTQQALQNRGYKVAMVRTGDTSCLSSSASTAEELQCRVDLVPKNNANAYVSIHINSATPAARGTESYYSTTNPYPNDSKRLATNIHTHFQPVFGSVNRGVETANYYVTKNSKVPATLIEIGFISNPSDLAKMKSTSMQTNVANAIAEGIDQYFGF